MYSFESDYTTGAHPDILKALSEHNFEPMSGYGTDRFCESAAEKIRKACACPDADVYFLVGGTQTNQVVISTMLHDYEGVIAAHSGHVSVHEAGAIEYSGHKVLELPSHNGKIDPQELKDYIRNYYADSSYEHMVFPGMVYISFPTEYGTLYSKTELKEISDICHESKIPLFIDGARLGYGLMSYANELSLADIAELSDVFYIGGTKVGALCGEAVVFTKKNMPAHFNTMVKQRGAMLAKGRLLGIQFDTLFTDDLYMQISRHAIEMAEKVKEILRDKGYKFFIDSPTNQQFVIIENEKLSSLEKNVRVSIWEKYDENHTVIRIATSWSTDQESLEFLKTAL